jgi:alcohol dehydrogenase class IV
MAPSLVILDAALSISTPERIWLSTGMRAVDHCVEGLCSMSSLVGTESDEGFSRGLRLLVPNLLKTKNDWENQEARLNEMMGVIAAMTSVGHFCASNISFLTHLMTSLRLESPWGAAMA